MKTCNTFIYWIFLFTFILTEIGFSQATYEVYVSSRGNNGVKKYDLDGNYLGDFVASGEGGLVHTEDILFMPDGTVLVSGFGCTAVKQYDGQSGEFIGDFTSGYTLASPSKISIGPDSLLYVTQWAGTHKVVRFDLDGNFVDEYTTVPVSNGLYHVWDNDGNFYIAEYGNGSTGDVREFDPQGNDLGMFIDSEQLHGPTTPWWDADSNMLVADWAVGKIFMFNHNGEYDSVFLDGLSNPEGVALRPDGNYMLGDWGVDAVHLFSADGGYMGYFTSGNGLLDPNSVKVHETTITGLQPTSPYAAEMSISRNGNSFRIEVTLPATEPVTIEVWDDQGRLAGSIADHRRLNRTAVFKWDPVTMHCSGICFIRLTGKTFCLTRKVSVL